MRCLIISAETKTKCLIISSEKNEAPHYFLRTKWSASFFSEEKRMHFILEDIKTCLGRLPHNHANTICAIKKSSTSWFLQKKMRRLIISSEKKQSSSLFLQKKMKCLIISSDKNEVPHYFFNNKWPVFSEEIMKYFVFFWRINEVLHFFIRRLIF
jgi:hypothetical protein